MSEPLIDVLGYAKAINAPVAQLPSEDGVLVFRVGSGDHAVVVRHEPSADPDLREKSRDLGVALQAAADQWRAAHQERDR